MKLSMFVMAASLLAVQAGVAAPVFAATVAAVAEKSAAQPISAPALDLEIQYYSKVLTAEGVTRESRYAETMLRRPGHVWTERVLPKIAVAAGAKNPAEAGAKAAANPAAKTTEHKEFNHAMLPRHVALENGKPQVSFVDFQSKSVVSIPAAEYDNVNFDGSWDHAFYLLDPKALQNVPVSNRVSPVAGARWREREKNGLFERILWDEQKQIPLILESGDKAATFYRRVEIKLLSSLRPTLPWGNLKGYAQKEYSDYLD